MGVLEGLSKVFSKKPRRDGAGTAVLDERYPDPVAIDLHTDPPAEGASTGLATEGDALPPMSRKEFAAELQKNYNEVLSLIRKVDEHLDAQEKRSLELMVLAERVTTASEALPEIRTQQARLNEAVAGFTDAARDHQENMLVAVRDQAHAIDAHTSTLREFSTAVTEQTQEMTGATNRLGASIARMRETDAERERELGVMVLRSQRAMLAVVISSAVLGLGAITIAIIVGLS